MPLIAILDTRHARTSDCDVDVPAIGSRALISRQRPHINYGAPWILTIINNAEQSLFTYTNKVIENAASELLTISDSKLIATIP